MLDSKLKNELKKDTTGLLTYEYIANNIGTVEPIMSDVIKNIIDVDQTGQFVVSAARYLNAIDAEKYAPNIDLLIKAAIIKDRERAYLPTLASSIWGNDYREHAVELAAHDDNFRRIYKRLYPVGI